MPDILNDRDVRTRFKRTLIPGSLVQQSNAAFWLERRRGERQLVVVSRPRGAAARFDGAPEDFGDGLQIKRCALNHINARALRRSLSWLTPRPCGDATSFGFGDRLGSATPGHIRAMRETPGATAKIIPFFAQQSIREMARTERTPDDVMTDATFGALQGGWRGPLGADADHLKTFDDIDRCVAAGFSFYTIDPSAHVDNDADAASPAALRRKTEAVDWATLETTLDDAYARYAAAARGRFNLKAAPSRTAVARAAAKYGNAIAHVAGMFRHLAGRLAEFDLEVSVDETETPTTPFEHAYIAGELMRLGVRFCSLAPRFVGRFEKGVDYLGDLGALRADLGRHAAVAQAVGGYKLSLHSGSDKFSVYPLLREAMGDAVHVKTAGTSYLEALRVCAAREPRLFRDIAGLARERYDTDKATYHISADLARVPELAALSDEQLPGLLDAFDSRQMLHVTFGSALKRFGADLKAMLRAGEDAYAEALAAHFGRHLQPLVQVPSRPPVFPTATRAVHRRRRTPRRLLTVFHHGQLQEAHTCQLGIPVSPLVY